MTSSKQRRSSLPIELIEEILHKIPTESLVRFKSTSKEWYALLSDKRFIYKLLDLPQKRFIRGADKSIQLVNPTETRAPMCLPLPDEFHNHHCSRPIHCDGLFLCKYDRKLAVWNPILSRVKWIEPSISYKGHSVYGFGYDNVSRDNYKILRLVNEFGKSPEVEIYEFQSKCWRSVDAPGTPERCVDHRNHLAVSMNGNMYWVVVHQNEMDGSIIETFIQSFDFSTETFKPICSVTDPFGESFDHTIVALSGFGGDRLSLLHHQEKHMEIEVWVTNKVTDGVVSLSKYFSFTRRDFPERRCFTFGRSFVTYFIHKTNKIMLWVEKIQAKNKKINVHANVYEIGKGQIKKKFTATRQRKSYVRPFISYCDVYVPSLVPVPE